MPETTVPDSGLVDKFLKRLISIEEQPVYLQGAQETSRLKKIHEALNKICESET